MAKKINDLQWVPAVEPDGYCKCSVCDAGWLRQYAIESCGELFCSEECAGHRAVDLLTEEDAGKEF